MPQTSHIHSLSGVKPPKCPILEGNNTENWNIWTQQWKKYTNGQKLWKQAIVNKKLGFRSYCVETSDGSYVRNRVHIRKSNEDS